MKKFIYILGWILLFIVLSLNILLNSKIYDNESVVIKFNKSIFIIAIVFVSFILCVFLKKLDSKINKENKDTILFIIVILYCTFQLWWILYTKISPVYDQLYTYKLAVSIYDGNSSNLMRARYYHRYFERYPQNLLLAKVWSIIFSIFRNSNIIVIQIINILANCISFISFYLILNELEKKQKINKTMGVFLFASFITIPMQSSFVYGDELGLSSALIAIYYLLKWSDYRDKVKYFILSMLFMSISYIARMNSLIFIIAACIYLCMEVYKSKKIIEIITIPLFILITIFPGNLLKNCMQRKYELDQTETFPILGYIYMGMQDCDELRQAGWYNDKITKIAESNSKQGNEQYKKLLPERINYFITNPIKAFDFYVRKTASMWTENTYQAVNLNKSVNSSYRDENTKKRDETIEIIGNYLAPYQKMIIIIVFARTIIVLWDKRKEKSNDIIILLLVFIGGFLFHTIWEAKSRYIIPYITILIPIASLEIDFKNCKYIRKEKKL